LECNAFLCLVWKARVVSYLQRLPWHSDPPPERQDNDRASLLALSIRFGVSLSARKIQAVPVLALQAAVAQSDGFRLWWRSEGAAIVHDHRADPM